MALATQYPGPIQISGNSANIVFGTVQVSTTIGNTFGNAVSASLKRTADQEMFMQEQGSLLALILRNPRLEFSVRCNFSAMSGVVAPGLGETIAFPLAGVVGRILDVTVEWADQANRQLSIEATAWDSIASPNAYYLNNSGVWVAIV